MECYVKHPRVSTRGMLQSWFAKGGLLHILMFLDIVRMKNMKKVWKSIHDWCSWCWLTAKLRAGVSYKLLMIKYHSKCWWFPASVTYHHLIHEYGLLIRTTHGGNKHDY